MSHYVRIIMDGEMRMLIWVNYTMTTTEVRGFGRIFTGICMKKLEVTMGDCRDEKKLNRFFPFEPKDHLIPRKKNKIEHLSYD